MIYMCAICVYMSLGSNYLYISLLKKHCITMSSGGSPPKPWEINRGSSMGNLRSSADVDDTKTPPPVPARPAQQRSTLYQPSYGSMGGLGYSGLGSYGSSYGLGGYGGMYGGGLYGGSGLYGSSYRPYGATGMGGGFSQQAEESTRQAFQSVESIVRAFTSVSAMLESTLGAVYSSFRAVLDVAEHFSRVKATFTDILSSIAIFRFLRYLYHRALALLRLRPYDEAWDGAGGPDALRPPCNPNNQRKSWPIMLFVAVVLGGPYLIWKLMRGITSQKSPTPTWVTGEGDHVIARAEFDFQSEGEEELSLQAGETIILAPKQLQPRINGWVIGTKDGKTTGYLPTSYVKILGLKRGRAKMAAPTEPTISQPVTSQSSSSPSSSMPKIAEEEWENIHSNAGALSSGDT